jgi:hypothetical protein
MQYMLLIYTDEQIWASVSDEERRSIVGEYFALRDELQEQDRFVAGAPLESVTTASSVRLQNGEAVVTDGPFAETKEQLGGYFLIEAESPDAAQHWAAKIPAARYGTVEVRPVQPMPVHEPAAS